MGTKSIVNWDSNLIDKLERLWNAGYSASIIADFMGERFTRNMVIGKIYREGFQKRHSTFNLTTKKKYVRGDTHSWSREDEDKLRLLWKMRIHWTQIRDQIDPSLTEHAIKSKANNLGVIRGEKVLVPQTATIDLSNPPPEERKTFIQLERGECKYPIGDPLKLDFKYCGRKSTNGPYCKAHHAICHQPPRVKEAAE